MYKLLIVDDEPLVRRGIKTLVNFEELNITDVFEASNGQEGLELFIQHAPHLVLLDINIPKLNGLDLAKAMKEKNESVKIAMITGYNYFDYAVAALKIGVEDYILKPVSKQDVSDVLLKLIHMIESERSQFEVNKVVNQLLEKDSISTDERYKESIKTIIDHELSNHDFSLTALGTQMGLSPGYLSNIFKPLFGQTFQDYVLTSRLEKSKLLLLTTSLKNYEIAEHVGFDDVNYFSTRFKIKYGISPKQYRLKVRSSDE